MRRHSEQIVRAADVESRGRVELHVAGDRVIIDRWGQVRLGQRAGAEVITADPNIAETGIALLVAARSRCGPVVGNDREVDVGLLRPLLSGFQNLILPRRGRTKLGVKGADQIAAVAVDVRTIRHEADRDQLRSGPCIAGSCEQQKPRFKPFGRGPKAQVPTCGSSGARRATNQFQTTEHSGKPHQ